MVERIVRAVLERNGIAGCLKGDRVRVSPRAHGRQTVSVSNDLKRITEPVASKIQKELLDEFLKNFHDVRVIRDEVEWLFIIQLNA